MIKFYVTSEFNLLFSLSKNLKTSLHRTNLLIYSKRLKENTNNRL